MPEGIKISLLRKEDVVGDKSLSIFKKCSTCCEQTELVSATKGFSYKNGNKDHTYGAMTFLEGVDHTDLKNNIYVYNCRNHELLKRSNSISYGAIRPVLQLPPQLFEMVIKNKKQNDVGPDTVEFGYYPQETAYNFIAKELNKKDREERLVDGTYTFDESPEGAPENLVTHKLYNYGHEKYARVKLYYYHCDGDPKIGKKRIKYRDKTYKEGEYAWFEVKPVTWYIDYPTRKLVCSKNLISGIKYNTENTFVGYYGKNEPNIYRFLNEHMLPDLLQFVELTKKETIETKTDNEKEVKELLETINQYRKYYLGKEDIAAKASALVKKYNADVKRLSRLDESKNVSLKVDYRNLNQVYNDLISDLNSMIDKLKQASVVVKPYFDLIDALTTNKDDELNKFIDGIEHLIYESAVLEPSSESLITELDAVYEKHTSICGEFIRNYKKDNSIKGKTLEELKLDFRKDLQIFLEHLNETAIKRDMVHEIMVGVEAIINNNYVETKNERAKYVLDLINEVVETIRKEGTSADLTKLRKKVNLNNIDYSKDVLSLLKDLNDLFKEAYRIELDIKAKKDHKEKYDNSMISFDVESIFEEEDSSLTLKQ